MKQTMINATEAERRRAEAAELAAEAARDAELDAVEELRFIEEDNETCTMDEAYYERDNPTRKYLHTRWGEIVDIQVAASGNYKITVKSGYQTTVHCSELCYRVAD